MSPRTRLALVISLLMLTVVVVMWLQSGDTDDFGAGEDVPVPGVGRWGDRPLQVESSEQCRECHPLIYDEWKGSHHEIAWVNPEPRRKELSDNFKNRDCIPCHAPRPLLEVGYGRRALERESDRDDGINCITCHKYQNRMAASHVPAAEANPPCNPVYFEPLTQMGLCSPCHDQHKVKQDWLRSIYAVEGPDYKDCNDCHMPVTPGPGTVGVDRKTHRSHAFPGCHDTGMLQTAATLEAAVSRAEDGRPLVSITVMNTGTGHNLPADERHRAVDVEVRFTPDGGEPGAEVRLTRFRNPYRHEFDIKNPFKETNGPLQSEVTWDGSPVRLTQVRIPPVFNPDREIFYVESTQLMSGEARGLWFTPPHDAAGTLRIRLYYKLNPYLPNDEAVVMEETELRLGDESTYADGALPRLRSYLGQPIVEEKATALNTRSLWGHRIAGDDTARLIADEAAVLGDRLDAMDRVGSGAGQAVIDALLLAMKDRSQQAFVLVPDTTSLGFKAAESPFGGEDTRAEIRWTAIQALERTGTLQALPDLISALYDRHPVVRNHAARALWTLGSDAGLDVLVTGLAGRAFENETANRFLKQITGEDFGFDTDAGHANKTAAAERWRAHVDKGVTNPTGVPRLGDDAALDHRLRFLVDMLGQHQFLFMEQARRALSAFGDLGVEHLEALFANERDDNQQRRAYAVQVLQNVATPRARALLRKLLADGQPTVRSRAAEALGSLRDAEAKTPLEGLLRDDDVSVAVAAARALGRLGDAAAIPALRTAFDGATGRESLRIACACALVQLGSRDGGTGELVFSRLTEGPEHQRTDMAVFLEGWQGDLKGYDPAKPATEQRAAVETWRKVLVP